MVLEEYGFCGVYGLGNPASGNGDRGERCGVG